jgi:hypothetical protein
MLNPILVNLLNHYCELVPEERIYKLGEVFNYYYADELKSKILTKKLIKIDIKSAFPTICELMFGSNSPFIKEMKAIDNKLQKNIFISTTLKNIQNKEYLLELNNYSKIVVFNYVFNNYDNIQVFEYQKDGVLFSGNPIFSKNKDLKNLLSNNFIFHVDDIDYYIRFSKTSYYYFNNELEVKGNLKTPPEYISNKIKEIIKDPYVNLNELLTIYNNETFFVYKSLNLIPELNKYFKFNNTYFLNKYGERVTDPTHCDPKAILKFCLFPILSMLRSQ